jgi:hypothetical protein
LPRIGVVDGGDVAMPHAMRCIPETNEVAPEARAFRQFAEIQDKIDAGLRREAHRNQEQ